jgi:fibro-slime domain-containing protein
MKRITIFSTLLATTLVPAGLVLAAPDGEDDAPEIIELTGVVRDFRETSDQQGHPDFEVKPSAGFGHYAGNVALQLGDDGKPVYSGAGRIVNGQARDAAGRNIAPHLANMKFDGSTLVTGDDADDDTASLGVSSTGGITGAASFNSWFRDVPGVNISSPLTLTFVRDHDGSYVFDDKTDALFDSLGGFFPIEDQLFGNPGGSPDRNFHFTFELNTNFTYDADGEQVFRFVGDDDVWVFIDGKLAIDLGGVHSATEQYIDLNRMGLVDGETYSLAFFFAERHRTQSNFRIVTNIELVSAKLPSITASFD